MGRSNPVEFLKDALKRARGYKLRVKLGLFVCEWICIIGIISLFSRSFAIELTIFTFLTLITILPIFGLLWYLLSMFVKIEKRKRGNEQTQDKESKVWKLRIFVVVVAMSCSFFITLPMMSSYKNQKKMELRSKPYGTKTNNNILVQTN